MCPYFGFWKYSQDEAADSQDEGQDGQDAAQDGQDESQDGQDEGQDAPDEAQDGQLDVCGRLPALVVLEQLNIATVATVGFAESGVPAGCLIYLCTYTYIHIYIQIHI